MQNLFNRLYYEPWELSAFENIENEWPLFLCYLVINAWFTGDHEAVEKYSDQLDACLITDPEFGIKMVRTVQDTVKIVTCYT